MCNYKVASFFVFKKKERKTKIISPYFAGIHIKYLEILESKGKCVIFRKENLENCIVIEFSLIFWLFIKQYKGLVGKVFFSCFLKNVTTEIWWTLNSCGLYHSSANVYTIKLYMKRMLVGYWGIYTYIELLQCCEQFGNKWSCIKWRVLIHKIWQSRFYRLNRYILKKKHATQP